MTTTTPVGDGTVGTVTSPFHVACPVHSPFRFRMPPQMNGVDYYSHHHVGPQVFLCVNVILEIKHS